MSNDYETFPKSDLRARVGLPEMDDRLKTVPPPRFRKFIIVGFILLITLIILVLFFVQFTPSE